MIKFLWLFFFVFVFANRNVHSLYDREIDTPVSHRFIRSAEHGDHYGHGHGNFHKLYVDFNSLPLYEILLLIFYFIHPAI